MRSEEQTSSYMENGNKPYAIYVHGIGSGASSGTRSAFLKYFPEYEWICPEVNENPDESVAVIEEYVRVFSPEMMAGTSLGGVYVAYVSAPEAIKIVCNASIGIEKALRKIGYGKHPFFCDREDGRKEFEINEDMVRTFSHYRKSHEISLGIINIGVFSTDDELVGQVESRKNAKLLEEAGFRIFWSDKFGHRLNENVAKKIPGMLTEVENEL